MIRSSIFYLLVTSLIALGSYGLWTIFNVKDKKPHQTTKTIVIDNPPTQRSKPTEKSNKFDVLITELTESSNNEKRLASTTQAVYIDRVNDLLAVEKYENATRYINEHYSQLSADDLDQIKKIYRNHEYRLYKRGDSNSLFYLSTSKANVYDDLESWAQLAHLAAQRSDWNTAFEAQLKASLLENDGIRIEKTLSSLVKITANLRAQYEDQGDHIGVHTLYERLYKSHPNFNQFQLELAYSYLRLKQTDKAKSLLVALQYDAELGAISKDQLEKLRQKSEPSNSAPMATKNKTGNIYLPMSRYGTNMVINLKVNQRNVPLLLDTGASITALDSNLIRDLGLNATGKAIQINTANGIRDAELYRVANLQLGEFNFRNVTVAGVDLGVNTHFSGLLGTDLLNLVNNNYSYLIDSAQNALVFTPKP